ncbi:chaplin family protein [Paractinoplanes maris]|uniref:chaplin family protein n=1 Tax=Paractinoplanes maris TaxID=1734446 RepID=UPI00201FE522|nr:chaplin family protein [Actinoplanes maris]
MKTWVRKTLSVGVLAAGALLFAPGAAHADSRQVTGSNVGALNGTQIAVPVQVPVNVVGNSLGILGVADAQGAGVNNLEHGRRGDRGRGAVQATGSNFGILNGTQAYLPVSVPVNVVGNAAALGGLASAQGVGVNRTESGRTTEHRRNDGPNQFTGSNFGIGNGTQLYAPVDVPINVCGNSLAILGFAQSSAVCANDVSGNRGGRGFGRHESARGGHDATQVTGRNVGILNGTQLYAPISLPVNLAGNSAALLGSSSSRAVAVNESTRNDDVTQVTGSNFGILNGTQVAVPINVPINACGNSLGILGAAHSAAACANGSGDDRRGFRGDDDWDGDHGHGRPGHHHGDQDWDDNDGDHGVVDDDDEYKGNGGVKDNGYGGQDDVNDVDDVDADDDTTVDDDADVSPAAGDGYTKPAAAGSKSGSKGGRAATESSPISSVTETVSGVGALGLLNTLR